MNHARKQPKKPWLDKQTCEAMGKIWVPSYHKDDGTLVHGFCRDIGEAKNRRPEADIRLKYHKEGEDETMLVAQYGNYKVHIFKDELEPERYTWAITKGSSEDDPWYDDATYPDVKTTKKEAEKILSGIVKKNDS